MWLVTEPKVILSNGVGSKGSQTFHHIFPPLVILPISLVVDWHG